MTDEIKDCNGKLFFNEKKFNKIVKKIVRKSNDISGKITLPKELIGQEVYVVWVEK